MSYDTKSWHPKPELRQQGTCFELDPTQTCPRPNKAKRKKTAPARKLLGRNMADFCAGRNIGVLQELRKYAQGEGGCLEKVLKVETKEWSKSFARWQ